jgi:hypothetical protein
MENQSAMNMMHDSVGRLRLHFYFYGRDVDVDVDAGADSVSPPPVGALRRVACSPADSMSVGHPRCIRPLCR